MNYFFNATAKAIFINMCSDVNVVFNTRKENLCL